MAASEPVNSSIQLVWKIKEAGGGGDGGDDTKYIRKPFSSQEKN